MDSFVTIYIFLQLCWKTKVSDHSNNTLLDPTVKKIKNKQNQTKIPS